MRSKRMKVLLVVGSTALGATMFVLAYTLLKNEGAGPTLTTGQIAQNYSEFFSVVHDRADIKEGTFELFPWSNDRFQVSTTWTPAIEPEVHTFKKLADGGTKLNVSTETFWLVKDTWGEQLMISILVKDKTGIKAYKPLAFVIASVQSPYVNEETAKRLQALTDGKHVLSLQVNERLVDEDYHIQREAEDACQRAADGRDAIITVASLQSLAGLLECIETERKWDRQWDDELPPQGTIVFELHAAITAIDGIPIKAGPYPSDNED